MQQTTQSHALADERQVLAARLYAVGLSLQQASAALEAGDVHAAYDRVALANITTATGAVQLRRMVEEVDVAVDAAIHKLASGDRR